MARERLMRAEINGDVALQKVLHSLASDQELSLVLRPALMQASKPLQLALSAVAPRSTGADARRRRAKGKVPLHTTIGISFAKSGGKNYRFSTSVQRVRIGPTYPAGAHGHLTEFGTKARYAYARVGGQKVIDLNRVGVRGGKSYVRNMRTYRGIVPAQHWMARTWSRMIGLTLNNLRTAILDRLMARAKKLRNQYAKDVDQSVIASLRLSGGEEAVQAYQAARRDQLRDDQGRFRSRTAGDE